MNVFNCVVFSPVITTLLFEIDVVTGTTTPSITSDSPNVSEASLYFAKRLFDLFGVTLSLKKCRTTFFPSFSPAIAGAVRIISALFPLAVIPILTVFSIGELRSAIRATCAFVSAQSCACV